MNGKPTSQDESSGFHDRLESYGIYQLTVQLFDNFWEDSEILGKDYRGRELVKQQVRALDSVCANIEEGYGRGFGKELPQHLKIARGEAREAKGRYQRCSKLIPSKTINTIENRRATSDARGTSRHPSPVPRHTP